MQLAPYFTPLLLFVGIGLTGEPWICLLGAVRMVAVHLGHGIWSFQLV